MILSSMEPLVVGYDWELYIKKMESFLLKKEENKHLLLHEEYDGISRTKNEKLYDILASKVISGFYSKAFSSQILVLQEGYEKFRTLETENQVRALCSLVLLLKSGRAGDCDLRLIGGKGKAGVYKISTKLSNWKGKFKKVCIVDVSSSGIYMTKSDNLLELLNR